MDQNPKKSCEQMEFCQSCAYPLMNPEMRRGNYCTMCTNEAGELKPRAEIQAGVAGWFKMWQLDKNADFMARADNYLKAMPAWDK